MKNFFLLLITALMLTGAGCSKSKDSKPDCNVTMIIPPVGGVTNFFYDDKYRLNMMHVSDRQTKLEYKGDSIIETEKRTWNFIQRYRYKVNAQGLPVAKRMDINESGSEWLHYEYEYNGRELVKCLHTTYYGSGSATIDFTWSNGNLTGYKYGVTEWKFEYYEDKPRMKGDGFLLEMLYMTGGLKLDLFFDGLVEIVHNKNLLKKVIYSSQLTGGYTKQYEYGFDKDGKIINVYYVQDNATERKMLDYKYECN